MRAGRGVAGSILTAFVLGLIVWAAPAAWAAPGSVTVTVHSVEPADSPDIYGFYSLSLRPIGGGSSVAGFQGVVPGEAVTLASGFGDDRTEDVPPGTYELWVGVGGPGTNAGQLAVRRVVVPDGGNVAVGLTVDDRLTCFTGTVRNADGSVLEPFALRNRQPGNGSFPAYVTDPGGVVYEFDGGCGIAGVIPVEVLDLDTFEPIAMGLVTAAAGDRVVVDVVIGKIEKTVVTASGNPSVKTYPAADDRTIIFVGAGSTEPVTLTFAVACPGGGSATAVSVSHGGTTVAATNVPSGSDTWAATFQRAELVQGDVLAEATCPGGTVTLALGTIVLYDPSGDITDADTDAPVVGATVTLHRVPGWAPRQDNADTGAKTCESNLSKPDGMPWSQAAPTGEGVLAPVGEGLISPDVNVQVTGADGRYAWDVSYGCWYVTVSAEGYKPLTSPVVGVPPEVTDLDLELIPLGGEPVCDEGRFSDVDASNSFCDEITWLVDEGIANGYADGSFKPAAGVSRQAIASWLFKYTGQPAPVGACDVTGGFTDVKVDHPFCHQIMWMVRSGLSNGYADGTFKPTNPISRQAMAAFLFRIDGQVLEPSCAGTGFDDVKVDHPFCQQIAWMVTAKITNGYSDNTFRPTATISRMAAAAFLQRFDALGTP